VIVRFIDNLDEVTVVFLALNNCSKSPPGQFLIELIFLLGQVNSSICSKVLSVLSDQSLKVLQCFAPLDPACDFLSYHFDLVSHCSEELLHLGDHVRFHIIRINLSHFAETVLVGLVFTVELALQISGNQGGKQVLRLFGLLALDSL